ncbi:MAG: transglutaminase family protein [Pseudomonadota bacterium]
MRLTVCHRTTYSFDPPMRGLVQSLRLWPTECDNQQVIDWMVKVDGAVRGAGFTEGAGDRIETVALAGDVAEATVAVDGTVETVDASGMLRGMKDKVPPMTYLRATRAIRPDQALRDLAAEAVAGHTSALDRAHALREAVTKAIEYVPGETTSETTAAEALAAGKGVCQDHAHAMIAAAHTLDIPARYVIGYLHADGDIADASHAWAELYVEDLGWVGFDAANGKSPDAHYIRLGSGFDAVDAAPIRGVAQGTGAEAMEIDVRVVEAGQ